MLAVVLVTLYFNIYTKDSRIFEPQKALLLRTLVTLMLGLWTVRTLEENREQLEQTSWWRKALAIVTVASVILGVGVFVYNLLTWKDPLAGLAGAVSASVGSRIFLGLLGAVGTFLIGMAAGLAIVGTGYNLRHSWRNTLRTAMVIPALAYIAVHFISTAASVFPTASFYGGYVRQQGTLTVLAYIGLFFILAFNLRTREQLGRLVTVILVTSIPSALYGVVQKFGIDPLPWMGDVEARVASTMGNAIFVAAYLIMMLPLTLSRLLTSWDRFRKSADPEATPAGASPITGSLYPRLLWIGLGGLLAVMFLIVPIVFASQVTQLGQTLTQLQALGANADPNQLAQVQAQIAGTWSGYGTGLLFFFGMALFIVALPSLFYTAMTLINDRLRPYAYLVALGTALAGAGALMLKAETRVNGYAWAGYLAGLCILALLSRWQHLRRPWGRDALWADAGFLLIVFQSLFLFMVIKAYLPKTPEPTWWPVYLIGLVLFFLSCYVLAAARIGGRVGYLAQVGGYVVLALVQLTCIVLTQSRGPLTGLLASLVIFALIWTWRRQVRWAFRTAIALIVVGGVFLAVFNLPFTPVLGDLVMKNPQMAGFVENRIEPMKRIPYLGRLGRIFDASGGTGKVRILIWFGDEIGHGSAGMIAANPLRALIGYGPEAMHVAYNPYYPPELAHVEKRNASPDRAHDAIIDELVTMGGLGLTAYLFYFASFFILAWRLIRRAPDVENQALTVGLFSLGSAHFVEALTGIPIVATRMYMWLAIGVAVALTFMPPFWQPKVEEGAPTEAEPAVGPSKGQRRSRRAERIRGASRSLPTLWSAAYIAVMLGALVLVGRVDLKPMWADLLFWRSKQMEAQADAYAKEGQRLSASTDQTQKDQAQRYNDKAAEYDQDSMNSLHRAISLMPHEDFYYLSMAQVYLTLAQQADQSNPEAKEQYYRSTEKAILTARDLSPLNTDHYRNLAALYQSWFLSTRDTQKLLTSIAYGEQAISLTRNNADLRNRQARSYLTALAYNSSIPGLEDVVVPEAKKWLANWDQYHQASGGRAGDTHLPIVAQYRQEAEQLLNDGQVERGLQVLAAAELQYSLFLDDKFGDTYLLLGDLYRQMNMPAEAALTYGAGVNVQPTLISDSDAQARLTFLAKAGQLEPLKQGYLDVVSKTEASLAASPAASTATKLHQTASQVYQAVGYIYVTLADNEQAIHYYQLAVAHSESLEARKNLALIYQKTGDLDKAIEQARIALDLAQKNNKSSDVTALQKFIEQVQGQVDQISSAESIVNSKPQDYQAHYDLAQVYWQNNKQDAAIEQARLALQYAPAGDQTALSNANNRLGSYLLAQKQYDEAEGPFLSVLAASPQDFTANYGLAQAYYALGQNVDAIKYAQVADANAPEAQKANVQALIAKLQQGGNP